MTPSSLTTAWPPIAAARLQAIPRVRFFVGTTPVGSIARHHLGALERFGAALRLDDDAVTLVVAPEERGPCLADINAQLRAEGLIVAWRDETFPLFDPASGAVLATFERAATRFWGTMTRGTHCNAYVCGNDGRPNRLWIARRSLSKATDPGKLDNLVGGGVPHGQTPYEALVREGWEEAGLDMATMQRAQAGRILYLDRDIPEGRMVEHVHAFDLELPDGLVPRNQDGEVSDISCMSLDEAAEAAARDEMTVDAALVTLDFLLRHRVLGDAEHQRLGAWMQALFEP